MNKKTLGLAVGAALAVAPFAASADVKLYGKLHVSVDYVDAKASTQPHSNKATTVSSNASRWGLDISEKLGGELTAIGKLEQALYADGETNDQTSHARWVGLNGKFGQITAGIHESPFKLTGRAVDLFPEYVGDNRNILVQGNSAAGANFAANNSSLGWEQRPANSVQYSTPVLNGFRFIYLWSADAVASTSQEDNRQRLWTANFQYVKGPLYVSYAYEKHFSPDASARKSEESETGQRLGASYSFGGVKLVALYQRITDIGGRASTDLQSLNRTSWGLGGAYTAGNNVFKLQYYKAGDLNNLNATTSTTGEGTGAKMWALGWDHLFSKTAKVYVAYAKTDNGTNAAFSVNGPGLNARSDFLYPGTGSDPTALSVGMVLDF